MTLPTTMMQMNSDMTHSFFTPVVSSNHFLCSFSSDGTDSSDIPLQLARVVKSPFFGILAIADGLRLSGERYLELMRCYAFLQQCRVDIYPRMFPAIRFLCISPHLVRSSWGRIC